MTFGEHRDEGFGRRDRRLSSSVNGVHMAVPDEMSQIQVGEVAARGTVNRVVLRSDQDSQFRCDLGIGRELAELRGCAPRLDAQEYKVHVAPFEDVNFEHRRADLHGKIVLRHEDNDSPTRQDVRDFSPLFESSSRRAQENDDESRPLDPLLRLAADLVNMSDRIALGQGSPRFQDVARR